MNEKISRMISEIENEAAYTRHMTGRKAFSDKVMKAMAMVPRDKFVPPGLHAFSFDNNPLSIGHGQTISQPYIVALMTDLLQLEPDYQVLEIGTGSGYQTAILAELVELVYSIELIQALGKKAEQRLTQMGYQNIECRIGNGYEGWPEHAPYDAIIVTAAAADIPTTFVQQLKPNGKLVIPVGQEYMPQELILINKDGQGNTHRQNILDVAFVYARHGHKLMGCKSPVGGSPLCKLYPTI
ncbi:MAG: protein-L-isoaspartate(D-aspartate) O-methyltransferase, partial [gamma proteobacterium symbiont of Lucinoma myriamae]|nr:protein-L-isoaspartate(D-aspartate) O-methyltransferase [gamma proteobacterium symbiont of Lucinoma myriamae]